MKLKDYKVRIINVLFIKMGIPVDIQSFLVEDDQLFTGIHEMATKCGIDTINENLISGVITEEEKLDFESNGVFVNTYFEVHIMYSYV